MFSQALRSTIYRLALAVMVLGMGVFFGVRLTGLAWAAPVPPNMNTVQTVALPAALRAENFNIRNFTCPAYNIWEWTFDDNRTGSVIIYCIQADGEINFFAQGISDAKRAARILSIALTAQALGKPLVIDYDLDDVNLEGCSPVNCRKIYRLGILH